MYLFPTLLSHSDAPGLRRSALMGLDLTDLFLTRLLPVKNKKQKIPHRQAHRPFLRKRTLHAIPPPAESGWKGEEEIDSCFNKPWTPLGVPRQPISLKSQKSYFSNYVEVLVVGCDFLPEIEQLHV